MVGPRVGVDVDHEDGLFVADVDVVEADAPLVVKPLKYLGLDLDVDDTHLVVVDDAHASCNDSRKFVWWTEVGVEFVFEEFVGELLFLSSATLASWIQVMCALLFLMRS